MKLVFLVFLILFSEDLSLVKMHEISRRNDNDTGDNLDIFSKCYEEIGCVETDSRWYDTNLRPTNLRPVDRHVIKTDLLLIKRHKEDPENLVYESILAKHDSIKSSGLDKNSDLMILIHDFTSNGYTGWVKHLANTIISNSLQINIISVDWQRGAEPPYDQAIANGRVVALEIVALIKELKEGFHFRLSDIHIVGHGVGAHIAGYVGATYNEIRKITGLDPSGPRFEGMPDVVKLDPTDARYVEVIHTDTNSSSSQGIKEALGHSDFYVNNGQLQPGCGLNWTFSDVHSATRNNLNEGEILPGCSHKRSFKYFIESIWSGNCTFLGIKCDTFEEFESGKCTSCNSTDEGCRTFGLKTYKNSIPKIKYFLSVSDQVPFCLFEYKITVQVKDSKKDGYYGNFDFIMVDENADVSETFPQSDIQNNYKTIKNGADNTFIYYAHPPKLKIIKEVKVRWNEKKKFYCIIFCKQSIHIEKVTILLMGLHGGCYENILCSPTGETEIENGSYRTFTRCAESTTGKANTTPIKHKRNQRNQHIRHNN